MFRCNDAHWFTLINSCCRCIIIFIHEQALRAFGCLPVSVQYSIMQFMQHLIIRFSMLLKYFESFFVILTCCFDIGVYIRIIMKTSQCIPVEVVTNNKWLQLQHKKQCSCKFVVGVQKQRRGCLFHFLSYNLCSNWALFLSSCFPP